MGYIFVADTENFRIQKFNSNGGFIRTWGTQGPDNGQFEFPADVSASSSGDIFIVDTENDRIQKFTNTGKFIKKWGGPGNS